MAGLTDVVFPVDSLSKLKMESSSEQGMAPSSGGPAPKVASPQGKGVGLFALETMAGEEVDGKIKDPKVSRMLYNIPDINPCEMTPVTLVCLYIAHTLRMSLCV